MWGEDPCGCAVPASCDPGAEPLSSPRRAKSRCAAREQKRKLQNWRLDSRHYRGTGVAEVARSVVRQERGSRMTSKPAKVHTPMADRPVRQRPVRVKLTRADAYIAATCPPDGEAENWWPRLNEALGTMSSDFVDASLLQLQAAARSPFGTISQTAMNAALAMITAAAPRETKSRPRSPFRWPAPIRPPCRSFPNWTADSQRSDELPPSDQQRLV